MDARRAVVAPFRVRRAQAPSDAAAAASIDAAVAPEGMLGVQPPVDLVDRTRKYADVMAAGDGSALFLLEHGDAVVGYATVHGKPYGVLSLGMALLPEARGQGGGRQLLAAVIEHGERSSAHKLDLEAWVDNARAIALYTAAGFAVEGVKRDHYRRRDGRLRSSILMARRLE
jgi:RimJ/RimL family protein N-acetyltransferase